MSPVDLLIKFIDSYQEGTVGLPHGDYAWHVATKFEPAQVWISETARGGQQVCGGGLNSFSVSLQPDGFLLLAKVLTDGTVVSWQAIAENELAYPGSGLVR